MIKTSLQDFSDRVLETRRITAEDVAALRGDILADGVQTREEADVLLALDRVVGGGEAHWGEYLHAEIVNFAVWTLRPTGIVDPDLARWLVTTLSCGTGPTENAARIAFEVVREAERVDELLLAFVLGSCRPPFMGRSRRPAAKLAA